MVAFGLGEGSDGGTTGGDTGEATNPGQCDTINAGCTAGEAEDALYTGDEIIIIGDTKEQQFYYHPDHLGSTAYITDSSGQLTEHLEYFPFGETWVQEGGSKKTPYLYTGKELDQETGLYYYGARYYDPRVSVWASPDPILEKYLPNLLDKEQQQRGYKPERDLVGLGGVYNSRNLAGYSFVAQNPIIYTDPDGNVLIGGAILGAVLDAGIQLTEIGLGMKELGDFSVTSVVISATAGSVGAGFANQIKKAADLGKKTKVALEVVNEVKVGATAELTKSAFADEPKSGGQMAEDLGESVMISNTVGRGVDTATKGKLPAQARASSVASGVVSGGLNIYQELTKPTEE